MCTTYCVDHFYSGTGVLIKPIMLWSLSFFLVNAMVGYMISSICPTAYVCPVELRKMQQQRELYMHVIFIAPGHSIL